MGETVRKLGRYEVIKHLASGGMAQVLLAKATGIEGFERYVVIKQIHVERARDPNVVKMFIDEARLAAALHHSNIVQVHDIGQEQGDYFIAMEYLHGDDLRTVLHRLAQKREQMPLEHVLTIIMAAAAALHHAHEQRGADRLPLGLVHRDVSPANIFVCYDGTVKVVDFGIAKAAHRSTETHSGTLKGKISYMAPEQCMGMAVDRRSDVFALGIVLYELFTVRRLFKAASEFLTMSAIVSGNIPQPSLQRATPPELEKIIMKALALEPAQRFQTADEMRLALDRFAAAEGLRTSTNALADYLVAAFGKRPEPWLDDGDAEIEMIDVDFDGSGSGVAQADSSVVIKTPVPGSLMERAQNRAKSVVPPAVDFDPSEEQPTTASGTPMAWASGPTLPAAPVKKKWPWLVAGAAVLAVAGVVVLKPGGGSSTVTTPAVQPAPVEMKPVAKPEPAPAPVVESPVVAPAPVVVAKPVIKKPVKPAPKRTKPAETKPADPQYDPNSLFPK